MNALLAGVLCALAACGGAKAALQAPATAPAATRRAATLTLVELKFYDGDDLGATLGADGTLQIKRHHHKDGASTESWSALVTLAGDGSLTRDGKPVGRLKPDGGFERADGSSAAFRIEGTTLTFGDRHVVIGDDGAFAGLNPGSRTLRVEGLTDDGSRRAALLVFAVVTDIVGGGPHTRVETSMHGADVKPADP